MNRKWRTILCHQFFSTLKWVSGIEFKSSAFYSLGHLMSPIRHSFLGVFGCLFIETRFLCIFHKKRFNRNKHNIPKHCHWLQNKADLPTLYPESCSMRNLYLFYNERKVSWSPWFILIVSTTQEAEEE